MFQQENVVFKIFNDIPVSIRYPDEGYPNEEYFIYILYEVYGGLQGINEIHDDVVSIWYNSKSGAEIVINTLHTEKDYNIEGCMVYCKVITTLDEHTEINIVKKTAKDLGMTQKELANYIGVAEDTLGKWSRGKIDTPKWAIKMFELLLIEKKFNTLKRIFSGEMNT